MDFVKDFGKHEFLGRQFGRLTVVRLHCYSKETNYQRHWMCKCACGKYKVVQESSLKSGCTKSCGCYRKQRAKRLNLTHGLFGTHIYGCYRSMRNRCEKPYVNDYALYGGRGISVCAHWKKFENFLADMGMPPSDTHSIDRIDNDKGYYKENCRWATPKQQIANQRKKATNGL